MGGEVDTHQLALFVQTFECTPYRHVLGNGWMGNRDLHSSEEGCLCLELILLKTIAIAYHHVQEILALFGARSEEGFSTDLLETVECTSKNQVFDVLLVALREVDTLKEVEEGPS